MKILTDNFEREGEKGGKLPRRSSPLIIRVYFFSEKSEEAYGIRRNVFYIDILSLPSALHWSAYPRLLDYYHFAPPIFRIFNFGIFVKISGAVLVKWK